MKTEDLKLNADGTVELMSVAGFHISHVAQTAVFAQIRYQPSQVSLRTGETETIQFALLPAQALALADALRAEASKILDQDRGRPVQ